MTKRPPPRPAPKFAAAVAPPRLPPLRIGLLTCLWRRPELTDFVLAHYAGVRKRLAGTLELVPVAVGSEGAASRVMAERHGFTYVEHPNQPLSDKWNAGLAPLRAAKVDAVFIIGSDDLVNDRAFLVYGTLLRRGLKFLGVQDLQFLDLATMRLVHWQGYTGKRAGEPVGLARCIHRDYLEAADWRLWESGLDRGLDYSMVVRLHPLLGDAARMNERGLLRCDDHGIAAVDVKSGYNMWAFEDIAQSGNTVDLPADAYLKRLFPAESVSALSALRERLHPPLAVRYSADEDTARPGPKVLLGTVDPSGQIAPLAAALRALNVRATALSLDDTEPGRRCDVVYSPRRAADAAQVRHDTASLALGLLQEQAMFHFFAGSTLTPDHAELPLLAALGAPAMMTHVGSELRADDRVTRFSPWAPALGRTQADIEAALAPIRGVVRVATVPDACAYEAVRGLYDQVHLVPLAVDPGEAASAPSGPPRARPLVVHITTDPHRRGSGFVTAALQRLAGRGVVDVRFVPPSFPPEDARDICADADIIVDQLGDGAYDVRTLQAMALGKPVVTWLCEAARAGYPEPVPVVVATPDTLEAEVERLAADPARRAELGAAARRYVCRWHDARVVAATLLRLYGGDGVDDRAFQTWWSPAT
jgi:hypothetical protein